MARKVIDLPLKPPPLPEKFPGEDAISRDVDRVLDLVEKDPLLNLVNKFIAKIPIVREKQFATPFGTYKTPEFYVPELTPAKFDTRRREALKASVMQDLVSVVGLIPGVSAAAGPVLDSISDMADAKIHEVLDPDEHKYFQSYNKIDPSSTVAMIRTMVRTQKER